MKVYAIDNKEDVRDILRYLKTEDTRTYILFVLMLYLGLRVSDVLPLRKKDFKGRTLAVKQKKTKKYVYIPVNRELKEILEEYTKGMNEYDYLIYNKKNSYKSISRQRAWHLIKEVLEEWGIENGGCHSLRKSFGKNIYESTGDLALTSIALGHKEISSTLRYLGIEQKEVNKAILGIRY